MKEFIKNSFFAKLYTLLKSIFVTNSFSTSEKYWEDRYKGNKSSGAGSYGSNAKFKSEIINNFVNKNKIKTVLELGCGDGNQLSLANYPNYVGVDVSETIINKCKKEFSNEKSKTFYTLIDFDKVKDKNFFDLSLSLDVIYHLVEDRVFDLHMKTLFYSSKYVIIFSTNFNDYFYAKQHVKNRKFTDWIDKNISNYDLIQIIRNENILSKVDFYLYKKID
ncbi:class I SAM-dependent methyltransferase [Acidimicrobiaceae bacterium]|nr:class I SAM-dependent methyltransferase [Acidimicrobiaceae bacterium]|tara:strand:- start:438 stop:1097 length:660 start_codon:yes stop_codon:yes gene_type:complete